MNNEYEHMEEKTQEGVCFQWDESHEDIVDMNVEDSFLVRDDLDNALFLDFLKEAEGFGSAPLEESAPVLLADDGFSALAYDVDLLNLVRGFRVVGVYQDLEERFQFSRSFVVYLTF